MPAPVTVRARAKPAADRRKAVAGTSIATYRARRNFRVTSEPAPAQAAESGAAGIFVVQKHNATRLHWDFRLEHGGVLWSWAVPKGPSLDPSHKRLAVHVEDHPVDYATFEGEIPEGQYGAGTVEIWDRGTWAPVGDAEEGLRRGELKFELQGDRLNGRFVLIRMKPRPKERAENWLLIKEHDANERAGADAAALEKRKAPAHKAPAKRAPATQAAPVPGAKRAALPRTQAPQLATLTEVPPEGAGWISELKFDGYRLLGFVEDGRARLLSRNGKDWTDRLPALAQALAALPVRSALLDGEMVAQGPDGVSDFSALKAALSEGRDGDLVWYLFDLLHLDGWDLRSCRLEDRKAALRKLSDWRDRLRYSDAAAEPPEAVFRAACAKGLEGIVCKQADAPYQGTRSRTWLKVKCLGRDEFLVIGWTPPRGSRSGVGALHLGYREKAGALHYAGGVGTGFSAAELEALRGRLDKLAAPAPAGLQFAGDPLDRGINWVRPELVGEVRYQAWTEAGRLRHSAWLGLREDKAAEEIVRDVAAPEAERQELVPRRPRKPAAVPAGEAAGVRLTHPEREEWPGISKRDLAGYWLAVADFALPEIARRPLAILRCPEGIAGDQFFQKHLSRGFPKQIRAGEAGGQPYLAIDDAAGLVAFAQIGAIELHAWGATEADALRPDRLIFDLDPGEGIGMAELAAAAKEVKARLEKSGLAAFCRTSGGKGLHVVAPLLPKADWDTARAWCRAFAEAMVADSPDRYVAQVSKEKRRDHILVDWLRNGLGSTAVASLSPRARPGAGVATRLAWREVTAKLDPAAFNLRSIPARLKRRKDPWEGFAKAARPLPDGGE